MPGWFGIVMGWSGLALAWHRAGHAMGEQAAAVALAVGAVALLSFALLLLLSLARWRRYPQAVQEDLAHPVRHAFIAAVPISLLLLVTLGVAAFGAGRARPGGAVVVGVDGDSSASPSGRLSRWLRSVAGRWRAGVASGEA